METIKCQSSAFPQDRQMKDVAALPLPPGGSQRVASCPELKEKQTSAFGKVEKVEEVRKVEPPPPKRPTLQNAGDGRTAPTLREKITAEEAEKQKFTHNQNNGRQDLRKPENILQGSSLNGISKTATEKPKVEPTRQMPAKENPEAKTAPWRQGRSGQQGEGMEKKGSRRQEQEAKVQEFLRDPNAPPGSSVPLEVRLRKPGKTWMDEWMLCWQKNEETWGGGRGGRGSSHLLLANASGLFCRQLCRNLSLKMKGQRPPRHRGRPIWIFVIFSFKDSCFQNIV